MIVCLFISSFIFTSKRNNENMFKDNTYLKIHCTYEFKVIKDGFNNTFYDF